MENFTFDTILYNLKNRIDFSYSRFGDGEMAAILGKTGRNTDGHEYFPDLGIALKEILESRPSYCLGLQNLGKTQNQTNPEFTRLVEMNKWVDNELIHHANIQGRLPELFEATKERYVILVGNETLCKVPFKYDDFVEIPIKNCWLDQERIYQELDDLREPQCVIMYCASMMSNVLTHRLHNLLITQIDIGSALDVWVGRKTRTYHKNMNL